MSRRELFLLAAVLLVQTLLVALVFTPQPHTGGDNAGYVSLAHSLLDRGAYLELWNPAEPPHTKYPPVFPVLLAVAMLLGAKGWVGLKLVPAFSTVLAVGFAYLWAEERRGWKVGVAVALLTGIASAVVYYSQWILSDPTFLAFTLAALWAFDRARGDVSGERDGQEPRSWLGLALALVVLAYFTRSAGLPLMVAALLWLAPRRRWKWFLAFVLVLGIPAFLWWLRGRLAGGGDYVSEFWLVDPYQPFLGRVGLPGLLARAGENLTAYVGRILPAGIVGSGRPLLAPLGVGLAALGMLGWILSVKKEMGVAELFAPLYFGLILLWPTAWSGDRFALPLFPLLFFYAAVALGWLMGTWKRTVRASALAVLLACLVLPAGQRWADTARTARACMEATRQGDPDRCLSPPMAEYFALAAWSGENLPDGAVVVTRKPRIFYVMSGVKAESIPLTPNPDDFLARVGEGGGHYLTIDYLDSMSRVYVYPVLSERPGRFCRIIEIEASQRVWTALVGVIDTDGAPEGAEAIAPRCPEGMVRATPRDLGAPGPWQIPLLVWDSE